MYVIIIKKNNQLSSIYVWAGTLVKPVAQMSAAGRALHDVMFSILIENAYDLHHNPDASFSITPCSKIKKCSLVEGDSNIYLMNIDSQMLQYKKNSKSDVIILGVASHNTFPTYALRVILFDASCH